MNLRCFLIYFLIEIRARKLNDQISRYFQRVLGKYFNLMSKIQLKMNICKQLFINPNLIIRNVVNNEVDFINLIIGVSHQLTYSDLPIQYYQRVLSQQLHKIDQFCQHEKSDLVFNSIQPLLITFYFRFIYFFRQHISYTQYVSLAKLATIFTQSSQKTLSKVSFQLLRALLEQKNESNSLYSSSLSNSFNVDFLYNIVPLIQNSIKNQIQLEQQSLKALLTILKLFNHEVIAFLDQFLDIFAFLFYLSNFPHDYETLFLLYENLANFLCYLDSKTIPTFHGKLLQLLEQNFRKGGQIQQFVLQIYIIIIQKFNFCSGTFYEDIANEFLNFNVWNEQNYELFALFSQYLQSWCCQQKVNTCKFKSILSKLIQIQPTVFTELSSFLIIQNQFSIPDILKIIFDHNADKYFRRSLGQQQMNKQILITLGVISYHYGVKLLFEYCNEIQKNCLEHFLLNQLELINQLYGKERKYIYILISQILFSIKQQLQIFTWGALFHSILVNIKLNRNIIPDETEQKDQENHYLSHIKWSFEEKIDDEEKYFIQMFNQFFDELSCTQKQDIGTFLEEEEQKFLTKLLYEYQ